MAQVDKFLNFLIKNSGSDLHLATGSPPIVRIDGALQKMKLPSLTAEQVKALVYEIVPERNRREYEATHDSDFAYEIPNVARFRTNIYCDINGPAMAQRLIPFDIMTVEDLGLPKTVVDLVMLPKGIILCTGPTGCGKSTTLAALLHHANEQRSDHVITIEDPVEFVHSNLNCIFSHRQVGLHTDSFKRALRAAFREDPDIILVGEMRDWRPWHWPSPPPRQDTSCWAPSIPQPPPARWTGSSTSSRRTGRRRSGPCLPKRSRPSSPRRSAGGR